MIQMIDMLELMVGRKKTVWKRLTTFCFKKRRLRLMGLDFGFTMIEILIAMAIISLLSVGGVALYGANSKKARDSRRLSDMNQLKTALDGYYDDNGCYPNDEVVNTCLGNGLQPYMTSVPCDPTNNETFRYSYERENCTTYRIYLRLENEANELINQTGCGTGCGPSGDTSYNYFVSSSNVTVNEGAGGVEPTCGGVNKYCFPGVCSSCCPGINYRCNAAGDVCLVDTSCNQ